ADRGDRLVERRYVRWARGAAEESFLFERVHGAPSPGSPGNKKPRRAGGGAGGLARLFRRSAHAQCSLPHGAAAADTRQTGAYRKHGALLMRRGAEVKNVARMTHAQRAEIRGKDALSRV